MDALFFAERSVRVVAGVAMSREDGVVKVGAPFCGIEGGVVLRRLLGGILFAVCIR